MTTTQLSATYRDPMCGSTDPSHTCRRRDGKVLDGMNGDCYATSEAGVARPRSHDGLYFNPTKDLTHQCLNPIANTSGGSQPESTTSKTPAACWSPNASITALRSATSNARTWPTGRGSRRR